MTVAANTTTDFFHSLPPSLSLKVDQLKVAHIGVFCTVPKTFDLPALHFRKPIYRDPLGL